MNRVVVTGFGAITPIGLSAPANWQSLMEMKSGVGPISLFDASTYSTRIAAEVKGFDPSSVINPKELKRMGRFIQFALGAGTEAVSHSGIHLDHLDKTRVGACVGVGIGGLPEIQDEYWTAREKGPKRISPFFIPSVIGNLAAGQLSLKFGLKGPNTCITTACSSSSHAIGESFRLIQRGEQDVMLAGGAEAVICELGVGGFCSMRALSQRNEEPERASRPFDKDRDGFVIGEGSAILILESLEHAKKRDAVIYAEVVGYGLNADAHHLTAPSPEGEGAARCMKLALSDAQMNPDEIDYINAHGTSTPVGDTNETAAIKSVFKEHAYQLAVSSTKSLTGHLLGAAGAVEALYCVKALETQVVPATANLENPSPECDLNYVPGQPEQVPLKAVLSNSFGFGGTNATLIFKSFEK